MRLDRPVTRWLAGLLSLTVVPGYRSVVHVPDTLDPSRPAPLVVFLHGCNETAEHVRATVGLDAEADRAGFVVLYPGFERAARRLPCWRARTQTRRHSADPAAIAALVHALVARNAPPIDTSRIYVAGVSSGAMMAVVLGATYPDRFAAIAVSAGCAYRARTCIGAGPSRSSATLAREALRAMGPRRRVMPVLIVHGDDDPVVPFAHSQQLLDQWRMTNNLVRSGTARRPIAAAPATVRTVTLVGRESTVTAYEDRSAHTVIERWTVHGLGHDHGTVGGLLWPFFQAFRNHRRTT